MVVIEPGLSASAQARAANDRSILPVTASLKEFYDSPGDTAARAIRQKASTGTLMAIEGFLS